MPCRPDLIRAKVRRRNTVTMTVVARMAGRAPSLPRAITSSGMPTKAVLAQLQFIARTLACAVLLRQNGPLTFRA